jgi:GDP-4-dehydro-6-deoxy-D-mannose reductase
LPNTRVARRAKLWQAARVRVFVTGAGGFVGAHLLRALRERGDAVRGSDRELDIADREAVAHALRAFAPDAVVHLAAQSSVALSLREPAETWRINYLGSASLLRAIADAAPRARLLFVSSADVYGPGTPGSAPFRESDPLCPLTPYGRSKAAAELLARATPGLDLVCARCFNHTGPGQADHFALPGFAKRLARIRLGRDEPRLAVGNLESVRDFLDVRDVVRAYLALLDPATAPGVYNVASGRPRTLGELLRELLAISGLTLEPNLSRELWRPPEFSVGDASRLQRATGWRSERDLHETLRELYDEALARESRAA